jgi:mlo protein
MLLGFISLLLTVFQGATQKICVRESLMNHLLPCPRTTAKTSAHFVGTRRLLAGGGGVSSDYCLSKVRVPGRARTARRRSLFIIFLLHYYWYGLDRPRPLTAFTGESGSDQI